MATIFTKILNKEIPSYKIAENEKFYAFLDINPLAKGHTLVIPKEEVDYIFEMDDNLLSEMIVFAKQVAISIEKHVSCKKIGMTVVGLEVAHAHIHLIPINTVNDMEFSKGKIEFSSEEFVSICKNISETYQELIG